jgi:hypothetical protein
MKNELIPLNVCMLFIKQTKDNNLIDGRNFISGAERLAALC